MALGTAAAGCGGPGWPPSEQGEEAAAECAYRYPDDLPTFAYVFDGTVVETRPASWDDDSMSARVELIVDVNESLKGEMPDQVVMSTHDFTRSDDVPDLEGVRFLAAANESLDVVYCGFTRDYSAQLAREWRGLLDQTP